MSAMKLLEKLGALRPFQVFWILVGVALTILFIMFLFSGPVANTDPCMSSQGAPEGVNCVDPSMDS